ncbi:MAG: NAD(P)-binding domain-containing protein [Myxococcaceae bacterium]|nr:NAD(P)-binding domain-containing protein [Myxococcaceae bacterium]
MHWEWVGLAVLFVLSAWGMRTMVRARRAREESDSDKLEVAIAEQRHIPPTLHPVIDPDRCIGSLSCLSACPEGDILGVVDGKAALINPSACIGHGKCALECPVDAIRLVFGTSERGVDLPEIDEHFETSRRGLHIVGELAGMGLIKNAITQGLQVARHLAQSVSASDEAAGVDVAVIGAGPAGLATALGLQKAGITFRVLEQDSVGGTIAHYPRQKVVMTERVDLPFLGKFGKKLISKEELLATWQRALEKSGVTVEAGVKVTGIAGQDGAFVVQTSQGPVQARKVVLAIGRRGSPRKLGVPGEDLPKVSYRLIDPQQYDGSRVLVVGGGDSALEAAIALANDSDAEVTLSYRNAAFGRCRDANKRAFKQLVETKRVRALMATQTKKITADAVHLEASDGRTGKLRNDFVIVCAGGELPTEFLTSVRVNLRRLFGQALDEGQSPSGTVPKPRRGSAKAVAEKQRHRRLVLALFALGALIFAVLAAAGYDYYGLAAAERLKHPMHKLLRPAGTWGHGVGIVATLFMLSNFLYSVRKRFEIFKGSGPIRGWLTFHQFVGIMSPVAIAFHATFKSNNVLATTTSVSVAVVVLTGLVGRFIFGLVPSREGRESQLAELQVRWERLRERIKTLVRGVTDAKAVEAALEVVTGPPPSGSFFRFLTRLPYETAHTRKVLRGLQPLFSSPETFDDFAQGYRRLRTLRYQVGFYQSLRQLMSSWRILHVVLAVTLVFMIAAHIVVSLYLGYFWVFK